MSRVWGWRIVGGGVAVGVVAAIVLVAGGGVDARGRTAAAVEISRPAPEVFAHLVRPELLTTWLGGLQESRPTSDAWPRVGAKAIERVGTPDESHELEVEITALEPDRLLELAVTHSEFTTRARYALRERDGRTVLIYEAQSDYKHPISRVLSPVLERLAQLKLEEDFLRLKLALEGPPKPVATPAASAAAPADTAEQANAPPTPVTEVPPTPAAEAAEGAGPDASASPGEAPVPTTAGDAPPAAEPEAPAPSTPSGPENAAEAVPVHPASPVPSTEPPADPPTAPPADPPTVTP